MQSDRAENFYLGPTFQFAKKLAERRNYDLMILTIKYGILEQNERVQPYGRFKALRNVYEIEKLQKKFLPKVRERLKDYKEVLVLAGAPYREFLRPLWREGFYYIKSNNIGDLGSKLSKMLRDDTYKPFTRHIDSS